MKRDITDVCKYGTVQECRAKPNILHKICTLNHTRTVRMNIPFYTFHPRDNIHTARNKFRALIYLRGLRVTFSYMHYVMCRSDKYDEKNVFYVRTS